jgi:hypothetical protein
MQFSNRSIHSHFLIPNVSILLILTTFSLSQTDDVVPVNAMRQNHRLETDTGGKAATADTDGALHAGLGILQIFEAHRKRAESTPVFGGCQATAGCGKQNTRIA